ASAAIARPSLDTGSLKGVTGMKCEDRLSSLYLAGSFVMPGSAEGMQLWIGKPREQAAGDQNLDVLGVIARSSKNGCEAQCRVTRFERFKKDLKPALMELDCEGTTIRTMRMPLHISWARGEKKNKFETTVRLGSSIYGVEEAPLHVEVNRYAVAAAK
ncbi:MAG: hypothetical protein HY075_11300, partial [Deltaproteobacteria bacterium]|nr:hypothetical protein [Deltaproteobacteria bacterium]